MGRSDRQLVTRSQGPYHGRGLISILQQEGSMSDMGFLRGSRDSLYLHTDQDLTHSREFTHSQWLSAYVLGHNSWRQLSYTKPHLWLGCCLLELCLARAASLSVVGLGGFLWSDGWYRSRLESLLERIYTGLVPAGSSNPWLSALHRTTAPVLCPSLHSRLLASAGLNCLLR